MNYRKFKRSSEDTTSPMERKIRLPVSSLREGTGKMQETKQDSKTNLCMNCGSRLGAVPGYAGGGAITGPSLTAIAFKGIAKLSSARICMTPRDMCTKEQDPYISDRDIKKMSRYSLGDTVPSGIGDMYVCIKHTQKEFIFYKKTNKKKLMQKWNINHKLHQKYQAKYP